MGSIMCDAMQSAQEEGGKSHMTGGDASTETRGLFPIKHDPCWDHMYFCRDETWR